MAAGGIVITASRPPLIAVVQRRKDDGWVLPKGKLKPRESALGAAQREATEETGHRVSVHEYLGVVSYESGDKLKIVQFWRMASMGQTGREPMGDIKAVKWLTLEAAIARLSQPVERTFLAHIGDRSLKLARLGRRATSPSLRAAAVKLRNARKPQKMRVEGPKPVRRDQPVTAQSIRSGTNTPGLFRRLFWGLPKTKSDPGEGNWPASS